MPTAAMSANKHTRSNKAPHGHARLGIDPLGRLAGTRRAKGAAKPKAAKPESKPKELPNVGLTIRAIVESTFDNRLGGVVARFLEDGYEIMFPPSFVGYATPFGMNEYRIRPAPHFLVLFKKDLRPAKS